jgi:hypothetical protein
MDSGEGRIYICIFIYGKLNDVVRTSYWEGSSVRMVS